MTCFLSLLSLLSVSVLSISIVEVDADEHDDLYNSVFRFSRNQMSFAQVTNALFRLKSVSHGLGIDDPRREGVQYWVDTADNAESKCTRDYDERVLLNLQHYRFVAEEERRAEPQESRGQNFNLETYVLHVRAERLIFCEYKIGIPFMSELRESTKDSLVVLSDLTEHYMQSEKDHVLGRRVGEMLYKKLDQVCFAQLIQSLDDLDFIKELYELHSPCEGVLKIADKYKDYCGLLSVSYKQSRRGLRDWMDKIEVCSYIEQNEQVFGIAAEVLREKAAEAEASSSLYRPRIRDNWYKSVFRYTDERVTATGVTIALMKLDSYRIGLAVDDARRERVRFWLEAASHNESKCNGDDDAYLRSELEQDRVMADRQARLDGWPKGRACVFNLDTYVKQLRSERLLYCESIFGKSFIGKLNQWKARNFRDIVSLTMGYRYMEKIDVKDLGQRVGALIVRRAGKGIVDQIVQSSPDINLIREQYRRHSPCAGLLQVKEQYRGYYSLITAPGNYQILSAPLTSFVDKISVCSLIEESEEVFGAAAQSLRQKGPARTL